MRLSAFSLPVSALALAGTLLSGMVAAQPLQARFEQITDIGLVLERSMTVADFDGDGIDEIFTITNPSGSQTSVLTAFKQTSAGLRVSQYFTLSPVFFRGPRLYIRETPQGPHLIMVAGDADLSTGRTSVRVFAGWPLSLVESRELPASHQASAIGDLDGDGSDDIVILGPVETRAFRISDGAPLWTLPQFFWDVALANLDADPALEVVLAGHTGPGAVHDGVTAEREWLHPEGFGRRLAVGNVGPGGSLAFVGARDFDRFTVFRPAPWGLLWEFSVSNTDAIAVDNVDGVDADEILQGDGQFGFVKIIDSQTRAIRQSISNPGHGVAALKSIRTRPENPLDIIFAPKSYFLSAPIVLQVSDAVSGETLASVSADPGGISATLQADIDADGRVEMVVSNGSRTQGTLRIYDRDSGAEEWRSPQEPMNEDQPFYIRPDLVLQVQADADAPLELVVVGRTINNSKVLVLDGATRAVQLHLGSNPTDPLLPFRTVVDAELLDFDGDGFRDLAVLSQPSSISDLGARLHVYSLRTGATLWESPRLGVGLTQAVGLHMQPGTGQFLLVAALPDGLHAFGVQSRQLEWTHPIGVAETAYVADAPGGPEIVVVDANGGVAYLDAGTRNLRRRHSLSGPALSVTPVPGLPALLYEESSRMTLRYLDGTLIGGFDLRLIPESPVRAPVSVQARGDTHDVLVGHTLGFMRLELNAGLIFRGTFED